MVTEEYVNKTIDETIKAGAGGRWGEYREGVETLAMWWKTLDKEFPGQGYRESFIELCEYIEDEATELSSDPLIRTKIKLELRAGLKPLLIH